MLSGYTLPPIDQRWLCAVLTDAFPSHKHPSTKRLLTELVHAYQIWWLLLSLYPTRKIAGPAPLWVVRQFHATDFERFLRDAFNYLGRLPQKTDIWAGELDIQATFDTARSLEAILDYPDMIWEPILRTAEVWRGNPVIRIS